jgi:hypothetical protein
MITRTVGLSRFSAPACAMMLTAVSAWAFVHSTASSERDPFQFASVMAAHAGVLVVPSAPSHGGRPAEEVPVYSPPDLLAMPPPCLGSCA